MTRLETLPKLIKNIFVLLRWRVITTLPTTVIIFPSCLTSSKVLVAAKILVCDVDSTTADGFAFTTPGKISTPRFVERSHQ